MAAWTNATLCLHHRCRRPDVAVLIGAHIDQVTAYARDGEVSIVGPKELLCNVGRGGPEELSARGAAAVKRSIRTSCTSCSGRLA